MWSLGATISCLCGTYRSQVRALELTTNACVKIDCLHYTPLDEVRPSVNAEYFVYGMFFLYMKIGANASKCKQAILIFTNVVGWDWQVAIQYHEILYRLGWVVLDGEQQEVRDNDTCDNRCATPKSRSRKLYLPPLDLLLFRLRPRKMRVKVQYIQNHHKLEQQQWEFACIV